MSGLSAMPPGVGSGLGLPCRVYVHRDGLEWAKRAAGAVGTGQDIARGRLAAGVGT